MRKTTKHPGYSQARLFPLTKSQVSLMVVAGNLAGDFQNYDFVALNVAVSDQLQWTIEYQEQVGQFVVMDKINGGRRKALHYRFPIPGSYRVSLEVIKPSGLTATKITKFIET
ncbi:MAG: hypothetical protein ACON48_00210 [Chitinophagales bacterium]